MYGLIFVISGALFLIVGGGEEYGLAPLALIVGGLLIMGIVRTDLIYYHSNERSIFHFNEDKTLEEQKKIEKTGCVTIALSTVTLFVWYLLLALNAEPTFYNEGIYSITIEWFVVVALGIGSLSTIFLFLEDSDLGVVSVIYGSISSLVILIIHAVINALLGYLNDNTLLCVAFLIYSLVLLNIILVVYLLFFYDCPEPMTDKERAEFLENCRKNAAVREAEKARRDEEERARKKAFNDEWEARKRMRKETDRLARQIAEEINKRN